MFVYACALSVCFSLVLLHAWTGWQQNAFSRLCSAVLNEFTTLQSNKDNMQIKLMWRRMRHRQHVVSLEESLSNQSWKWLEKWMRRWKTLYWLDSTSLLIKSGDFTTLFKSVPERTYSVRRSCHFWNWLFIALLFRSGISPFLIFLAAVWCLCFWSL